MDIISLGFLFNINKDDLEKSLLQHCGIKLIWDFEKYNIESIKGIQLFKEYFKINTMCVLLDADENKTFTSYPLIYEISEYYLSKERIPKLFNLIDILKMKGMNDCFFSFSDFWDDKTLIRIKELNFEKMKNFLDNIYVWCETYTNLMKNEDIRIDDHPLVIRINEDK